MNLRGKKPLILLGNPFVYIAGGEALGLGLAAIVLAGILGAFSHTHLDGVLDLHSGRNSTLAVFIAEGLIDWLSLSLTLLLLGRLVSRTPFRLIDLFGTQALARWPALLMLLLTTPPAFRRFTHDLTVQLSNAQGFPLNAGAQGQVPANLTAVFFTPDAVYFFVATLLILLLLCWMVVLMYRAFSVSCNVRGARAIGIFVLGLVVAEIVSKFALVAFIHLAK